MALPAAAESPAYPTGPVHFVVPYTPGGASDNVTRVIAQKLSEIWKVPVIVINRGGAGGSIGTESVARAAPDGYTMLMATVGTHGINSSLYRTLPYDPVSDFEPVCLVASTFAVLAVNPSVPAKSVAELIAYAQAHPGELNFGSSGVGTSHHLAGAMFNMLAHVNTTHIPFKGTAEMMVGLLAGQVQFTFDPAISMIPFVKSGKVRALAVTSPQRSSLLPDLPTMAEAGLPEYDLQSWYGVLVPAKTPPDIVAKINDGLMRAIRSPDVAKRLDELGAPAIGGTPAELRAHIQREIKKWAVVVKESGARINN
jgi:tripartite-type tricarboxylate transporter receptor subunit TctC